MQYRGPLQYEYLDMFVQSLLKPLKRIETVADLYKLLTQSTVSCQKLPLPFDPFVNFNFDYKQYHNILFLF